MYTPIVNETSAVSSIQRRIRMAGSLPVCTPKICVNMSYKWSQRFNFDVFFLFIFLWVIFPTSVNKYSHGAMRVPETTLILTTANRIPNFIVSHQANLRVTNTKACMSFFPVTEKGSSFNLVKLVLVQMFLQVCAIHLNLSHFKA